MAPRALMRVTPAAPSCSASRYSSSGAAATPAVWRKLARPAKARPAEPVIPLVHAPDDPGPGGPTLDGETPEAAVAPGAQPRKIRDLFK